MSLVAGATIAAFPRSRSSTRRRLAERAGDLGAARARRRGRLAARRGARARRRAGAGAASAPAPPGRGRRRCHRAAVDVLLLEQLWLPEILQASGWRGGGNVERRDQPVQVIPAFAVPVLAARTRNRVAAAGSSSHWRGSQGVPVEVALLWMVCSASAGRRARLIPGARGRSFAEVASMTRWRWASLVAACGPALVGAAHDASGGWTVAGRAAGDGGAASRPRSARSGTFVAAFVCLFLRRHRPPRRRRRGPDRRRHRHTRRFHAPDPVAAGRRSSASNKRDLTPCG